MEYLDNTNFKKLMNEDIELSLKETNEEDNEPLYNEFANSLFYVPVDNGEGTGNILDKYDDCDGAIDILLVTSENEKFLPLFTDYDELMKFDSNAVIYDINNIVDFLMKDKTVDGVLFNTETPPNLMLPRIIVNQQCMEVFNKVSSIVDLKNSKFNKLIKRGYLSKGKEKKVYNAIKNTVFLVPINEIPNSSKSWEINGHNICIPSKLPDFITVVSEEDEYLPLFTNPDNSELDIFALVSAKAIAEILMYNDDLDGVIIDLNQESMIKLSSKDFINYC